jgi:hypothetical protein
MARSYSASPLKKTAASSHLFLVHCHPRTKRRVVYTLADKSLPTALLAQLKSLMPSEQLSRGMTRESGKIITFIT